MPIGNRARIAVIGGAKSSESTKAFIRDALNCTVVDGYGSSEVGGLASNGQVNVTLQLIDVPELGWKAADGRGEIVANSGDRMSAGYYRDDERTNEAFVTLGGKRFFRTGDLGELKDGKVVLLGRHSALIKLAQGAFVDPAKIEAVFEQSSLINVEQATLRSSCHTIDNDGILHPAQLVQRLVRFVKI